MAHVFLAGVILRFRTGWSQDLTEKQIDDFMRTQLKKGKAWVRQLHPDSLHESVSERELCF